MINLNIPKFAGFNEATFRFLRTNYSKNSKAWFENNREQYQRWVLLPFQSLVCDLTETMLTFDPWFEIRPAIDKTISRIYRDTRFSKDKTLYRENLWLTFKRPSEDWKGSPAFFFELFPSWYRYGMGYYSASSTTMQKFRSAIDDQPDTFLKVTEFYRKKNYYRLEGERYKRQLPVNHPSEIQEWYSLKSFYLVCNKKKDRLLTSSKLIHELKSRFLVLKLLYQYLIVLHDSGREQEF